MQRSVILNAVWPRDALTSGAVANTFREALTMCHMNTNWLVLPSLAIQLAQLLWMALPLKCFGAVLWMWRRKARARCFMALVGARGGQWADSVL